jgi:exosortase E/protease (VPEID-CTERM system)
MRGLATVVALIAAEYLLIAATIDVRDLHFLDGVPWLRAQLKTVPPLVLCVTTAMVVLGGRGLRAAFAAEPTPLVHRQGVRLYAHLSAYAGFFGLTLALLRDLTPASSLGVSLWATLAVVTGCSAVLLAVPRSALRWAMTAGARVCIAGLAAGALSLAAGLFATSAWPHLASASLRLSSLLLALSGSDVIVDYSARSIRVDNFEAEIAAACSGVEGMGLMVVLVGAYLFAFRRELRFPAALLLLPVSVMLAFCANALRIAALMLVGSKISVQIANSGFHSKAGWVVFCAAAVGLLYGSRNLLTRDVQRSTRAPAPLVEGPLAAYIGPQLCLLGSALLTGLWAAGVDRWMALRFVVASAALSWLSRPLLKGLRVSLPAVVVGVLTYLLWIALVKHETHDAVYETFLRTHGRVEVTLFLLARVVGSVLVVPIAEELAFRGFLARWPSGANFQAVRPAYISMQGLLLSSAVFGVLHSDMLAGAVAGIFYCLLYRRTESIADPIVAHAVTNGLIAIEVLALGHYGRW